jgi:predicted RNase H-like nuclease (RuvC/YqgF family)
VSWPRDAFAALRQIVLIDNRINSLSDQVKELAAACQDLDRRLIRLEAKFELLERMAAPARRALPEKSEK